MPKHELASATCITVTPLPKAGMCRRQPGPHLRRHAPTTASTQAPPMWGGRPLRRLGDRNKRALECLAAWLPASRCTRWGGPDRLMQQCRP